ncbi:nucleotidase [Clostridium polyendosporum]|uniref:Nucleotidase n=1 Tax=Clostridium polyendosporum TaxID=69208 RepID=A0A919S1C7_9CLOT|nr:hypothetical protein [Clostridium polyendosporum]GIM29501.1 nucleotidase [Clostridium polyendosporum]
MQQLNICIDIDGTITDPYYWLDISNKFFNKSISEEQVTEYHCYKVMGVEQEEYREFYENYKFEIHSKQELRENVRDVLEILSINHKIFFITARDSSLSMLTYSYLKTNNISFNDLFLLGSHYKVDKAKELNCSVFIEDNYDNAIQLSENGFKVLLIDTNYNRNPINDRITRVYNWNDIYTFINSMCIKKEAI